MQKNDFTKNACFPGWKLRVFEGRVAKLPSDDQLEAIFVRIDKDGSGSIDKEELGKAPPIEPQPCRMCLLSLHVVP